MNSVIKSFDVGVCLLTWKDVPEVQEQEENPHFRGCPDKGVHFVFKYVRKV